MARPVFVLLHGLLSSSKSRKAALLAPALAPSVLVCPDQYPTPGDFEAFTLTRGLSVVSAAVRDASAASPGAPVVLVGSSCGGLLAVRFLQARCPGSELVRGLVLLAPAVAFGRCLRDTRCLANLLADFFPGRCLPRTREAAEEAYARWRRDGWLEVAGAAWPGRSVRWPWAFAEDLEAHHDAVAATRDLGMPGLVVQGEADGIVDPRGVREWLRAQQGASADEWEGLFIPDGNHDLSNATTEMVGAIKAWVSKTFPEC
eukprot:m51a1_g4320 hypothetical protein (259) ;mRNA; f:57487-58263